MVELRHLAALVAVHDEGSFGRAADRLGYTQSSVSQQIATLEKALGGAVFDRPGGPRPVQVTPLGSLVVDHARTLLAGAARLTTAVDRFMAGDGRVDIGTFQSVTNVMLPRIVQVLREEHPACDIRLFEEETDEPDLAGLDLMFFDGRPETDLDQRKLLEEPYLLATRRGDLAPGPVSLSLLDQRPLVAHPPICDQARVEFELARKGVRPDYAFRTVGNDAVLSMVRAGMGWAVVPWLAVHGPDGTPEPTLDLHALRPGIPPREILLLWQAGRTHSPLAARAIEVATHVAQEIGERIAVNGWVNQSGQ